MDQLVRVGQHAFTLTHPDKIFWPEGLTKADLVKYYMDISAVILPYLKNRPLVMKRYPDGIDGVSFYQKECPDYAPEWIETYPVQHTEKVVNYIVCNDAATLSWLANKGCIEIHAWLSKIENIDCPDIAVMDLDPSEGAQWGDVMEVALLCRKALEAFDLIPCIKTSGASGLHLFIPLSNRYSFGVVTEAMHFIADLIVSVYPQKATVERTVSKRNGKVYLDYLQNGRGKTMAFPYSLRPLPGAPVSAPLFWDEVEAKTTNPTLFNIKTIFKRLDRYGDLMSVAFNKKYSLEKLLSASGNQKKVSVRAMEKKPWPSMNL